MNLQINYDLYLAEKEEVEQVKIIDSKVKIMDLKVKEAVYAARKARKARKETYVHQKLKTPTYA